jgi:hypothetical protein
MFVSWLTVAWECRCRPCYAPRRARCPRSQEAGHASRSPFARRGGHDARAPSAWAGTMPALPGSRHRMRAGPPLRAWAGTMPALPGSRPCEQVPLCAPRRARCPRSQRLGGHDARAPSAAAGTMPALPGSRHRMRACHPLRAWAGKMPALPAPRRARCPRSQEAGIECEHVTLCAPGRARCPRSPGSRPCEI